MGFNSGFKGLNAKTFVTDVRRHEQLSAIIKTTNISCYRNSENNLIEIEKCIIKRRTQLVSVITTSETC